MGCIIAQRCLPARRQQAGRFDAASADSSGWISPRLNTNNSRLATGRTTYYHTALRTRALTENSTDFRRVEGPIGWEAPNPEQVSTGSELRKIYACFQ